MSNLLLENDKTSVLKEYRFRVAIVALGAFFCVMLIGIALLIPSYVLMHIRYKSAASRIQSGAEKKEALGELQKRIDEAKSLATVLEPSPSRTIPTNIIQMLVRSNTARNSITDISLDYSSTTVTVSIAGQAATRQNLLTFKQNLEKETGVELVDIPISDFAKDSNISFRAVITVANK